MNFHRLVSERLDKIRAHLKGDPDSIADRMVHGRFERIKCSYGTAASSALPTIPLEIPGLEAGYSIPHANIEGSKMVITTEELKLLFDMQIDRMLSVIDEQFDRMHENHPGTRTVETLRPRSLLHADLCKSYLVLSGGLGCSPYVRDCLRSYYNTGPGSLKPGARGTSIVTVAEPSVPYLLIFDGLMLILMVIFQGNLQLSMG